MLWKSKTTRGGRAIAQSLHDCPDDWVFGEYRARHKPSGIELWIANGPHYLDVNDGPVRSGSLTRADRRLIWCAYQEAADVRLARVMTPPPERGADDAGHCTALTPGNSGTAPNPTKGAPECPR